jgi:hypothetical protein
MDEGPREINGVTLYTKSSTLRQRYSVAERLTIAGATEHHLATFIKWFCPYAPAFAITKSGSDDPRAWVTAKGKLCSKHVVRHLLGDAIPGIPAKWVAPCGAMYTRWIGLDIDFRDDNRVDFERRVCHARWAMQTLGYENDDLLWSPTPSGGLHVRGFLAKTMFTYQVEVLFDNLGITHSPGQIEVYPREHHPLRLPFGKIPGRSFDASEWVRFADMLSRKGGVCRLDPYEMLKQSESHLMTSLERETHREESSPAPTASVALATPEDAVLPLHRPTEELAEHPPATPEKITCRADAEAMYKRGIWRPGMRVDATKQLAWHYLKARGKSIEETTDLLTRWSYDTGRTTSVDVQQDLANGTTEVADQVEEIVRSIASFPTTGRVRPHGVYREEVEWIVLRLKTSSKFERDIAFACQMLKFAKRCGQKGEESWTAMVAVAKVMRTWPRFTGRRYLAPRKALQEHGVIVMLKEKVQTPNKTGRPRTWGILVPPLMHANAMETGELPMGIEEAVAYALQVKEEAEAQRDSYLLVTPPASSDSCREIGVERPLHLSGPPVKSTRKMSRRSRSAPRRRSPQRRQRSSPW